MTHYLTIFLVLFFSTSNVFADYIKEQTQIVDYCLKLKDDKKKLEYAKNNPFPFPTKAFKKTLKDDPKEMTYYLMCGFLANFKSDFDTNYKKKMASALKRDVVDVDFEKIKGLFGQFVYADKHELKYALVGGAGDDMAKYYFKIMDKVKDQMVIENAKKPKK